MTAREVLERRELKLWDLLESGRDALYRNRPMYSMESLLLLFQPRVPDVVIWNMFGHQPLPGIVEPPSTIEELLDVMADFIIYPGPSDNPSLAFAAGFYGKTSLISALLKMAKGIDDAKADAIQHEIITGFVSGVITFASVTMSENGEYYGPALPLLTELKEASRYLHRICPKSDVSYVPYSWWGTVLECEWHIIRILPFAKNLLEPFLSIPHQ